GEHGFSGSRQPAGREEFWRSRLDQAAGEAKIGLRETGDLWPFRIVSVLDPRRRDLGADRSAERQEQRQRRERIKILRPPRLREIAVEHDIRRPKKSAL